MIQEKYKEPLYDRPIFKAKMIKRKELKENGIYELINKFDHQICVILMFFLSSVIPMALSKAARARL